jgi:hypothetical protein
MFRRTAAVLAALSLVLLIAAPAFANDLHQFEDGQNPDGIASDNPEFQGDETECPEGTVDAGEVLWHFVHVGTDSSDLPSTLTATFADAGTVTVSGYVNGNSIVMYDIITGPDTLLSASDTIITNPMTEPLNLSHICNGGPPPVIPEAPASILLVVTAGLAGLAFVTWRLRRSGAVA